MVGNDLKKQTRVYLYICAAEKYILVLYIMFVYKELEQISTFEKKYLTGSAIKFLISHIAQCFLVKVL